MLLYQVSEMGYYHEPEKILIQWLIGKVDGRRVMEEDREARESSYYRRELRGEKKELWRVRTEGRGWRK